MSRTQGRTSPQNIFNFAQNFQMCMCKQGKSMFFPLNYTFMPYFYPFEVHFYCYFAQIFKSEILTAQFFYIQNVCLPHPRRLSVTVYSVETAHANMYVRQGYNILFAYLFLIAIAYSSAVISFQKDQVQSHFSLTLTHLENIFDKLPSELFGLQIML